MGDRWRGGNCRAAVAQVITVEPWSDAAESALGGALGRDTAAVAAEVEAGRAVLYRFAGESAEGFVVCRLECFDNRRELVCVAGAGRGYNAALAEIEASARKAGIDEIRVHALSPGVVRLARRSGFELAEYVCRKGLKNG